MADFSLAATPLSHNDITGLSQLFERAFHYHRQRRNQFKDTRWQYFLKDIRTVIGLGFAANLVNGDLLEMYDSHLTTFLQYQAFINPHAQHAKLAKAFANLVSLSSDFFRCLDHPRYYEDFLLALRHCVMHITQEIEVTVPPKAESVITLILA